MKLQDSSFSEKGQEVISETHNPDFKKEKENEFATEGAASDSFYQRRILMIFNRKAVLEDGFFYF